MKPEDLIRPVVRMVTERLKPLELAAKTAASTATELRASIDDVRGMIPTDILSPMEAGALIDTRIATLDERLAVAEQKPAGISIDEVKTLISEAVPVIDATAFGLKEERVQELMTPLAERLDQLASAPPAATQSELEVLSEKLAGIIANQAVLINDVRNQLKTAEDTLESLKVAHATELDAARLALGEAEKRFASESASIREFCVRAQSAAPERWAAGIYREGTKLAHNFGDEYIALKDTAEEPSPGAADWRMTRVGMRLRSDNTGEHVGDLFMKDYSQWLMGPAGPVLFAARGAKGTPGISVKGEKGERGDDGFGIAHVECSATGIGVVTTDGRAHTIDLKQFSDHVVNELLREMQ
jgi:hypothetical protein